MRWDHPQAAWNATCDAASQRDDELPLAMPMVGYFCLSPDYVNAHGNDRRGEVIHLKIEPGVVKRLSHD
jgi:hypothetical protein